MSDIRRVSRRGACARRVFLLLHRGRPAVELATVTRDGGGVAAPGSPLARSAARCRPRGSAARTRRCGRTRGRKPAVRDGCRLRATRLRTSRWIGRPLRPPAQCADRLARRRQRTRLSWPGWLAVLPARCRLRHRPGFLEPDGCGAAIAARTNGRSPRRPIRSPALLRSATTSRARHRARWSCRRREAGDPSGAARGGSSGEPASCRTRRTRRWSTICAAGVQVFDPSASARRARGGRSTWRPTRTGVRRRWSRSRSVLAASSSRAGVPVPRLPTAGYRIERVRVTNIGDIAAMLDLPAGEALIRPKRSGCAACCNPTARRGAPTRTRGAPARRQFREHLFTPVDGLGHVGRLAEHLSLALGRPLDRIVRTTPVRMRRAKSCARSPTAHGKRVVIYQFAERELAFGDWQLVPPPQ